MLKNVENSDRQCFLFGGRMFGGRMLKAKIARVEKNKVWNALVSCVLEAVIRSLVLGLLSP